MCQRRVNILYFFCIFSFLSQTGSKQKSKHRENYVRRKMIKNHLMKKKIERNCFEKGWLEGRKWERPEEALETYKQMFVSIQYAECAERVKKEKQRNDLRNEFRALFRAGLE